MSRNTGSLFIAAAALLFAAGCGDGDGDGAAAESADDRPAASTVPAPPEATEGEPPVDPPAAPSGSGSGTVVLDGEAIALTEVLCHLESQPAAGVGGNIEFVVQGHGADAAGQSFMIDISRYDDESMFPGDSVQLYVGDITSGEARELSSTAPAGTVGLVGSTATVTDLVVEDLEQFTEHTVSFDIACG